MMKILLVSLLFISNVWGMNNSYYLPKFEIFTFEISSWYILLWSNIFFGKIAILYFGHKKGWNFSNWIAIVLFATTGAAIGSIILPSIVGTLIGFLISLVIGKYALGFKHDIGIVISLFIAIAFTFGRVGCLLNGCCFGSVTDLPWGITYPVGTFAHWFHFFTDLISNDQMNSASVHPTQIYEIIFHSSSAVLIVKYGKQFKNSLSVLFSYLGFYFLLRLFIEYVRDMNNIWWSGIDFGILSLFQWFLLFAIFLTIISVNKLENNNFSFFKTVKSNTSIKNNFLMILMSTLITIVFKDSIHSIHLIQIAIMLPISSFLYFLEIRKKYAFISLIPKYATASICVFLISTPAISQLKHRIEVKTLLSKPLNAEKKSIFIINENKNSLLKIGDKNISFKEFNRRKSLLNLNLEDKENFNKIKISKPGIEYYGAIGFGKQEWFESGGCGGESYLVQHTHLTTGFGSEKIKVKDPSPDSYGKIYIKGSRYNIGLYKNSKHGDSQLEIPVALHLYRNIEFKWIGFGGGPSLFYLGDEGGGIIPNFHLRLGNSKFNIQAGLNDRYVGYHNPLASHLSIRFGKNFGLGIMNQSGSLETMAPYVQSSTGQMKSIFSFGPTGASLALKLNLRRAMK